MISCSHWGWHPLTENAAREVAAMVECHETGKPVGMPPWWAGSPAYQHLNFGPYLD